LIGTWSSLIFYTPTGGSSTTFFTPTVPLPYMLATAAMSPALSAVRCPIDAVDGFVGVIVSWPLLEKASRG
jgi:hypothetical protein